MSRGSGRRAPAPGSRRREDAAARPAALASATGVDPGNRARLVSAASDLALAADPLAHLYVSDAGGALRTLLGDAHRHWIATYPSWKTMLPQPHDGEGEHALVLESETRHDVVDYQTQAFRLRMILNNVAVEWICDHLRQLADGSVEAIEVKQHPSQMDAHYVAKILRAREILARIGWRLTVRYERDIIGSPTLETNRALVAFNRSAHVSDDQLAAFERLRASSPSSTWGAVRDAMDDRRIQGAAVAHSLVCAGRIAVDLSLPLEDWRPIELLAAPSFISMIRF